MPSSCARLASAPDRQGPTGLHRLQGHIYETHKARCIFEQPGHRNSPASESGAKFGFVCRACPRGLREQARRLNAKPQRWLHGAGRLAAVSKPESRSRRPDRLNICRGPRVSIARPCCTGDDQPACPASGSAWATPDGVGRASFRACRLQDSMIKWLIRSQMGTLRNAASTASCVIMS